VWHIDPLLDDCEINKYTSVITKYQLREQLDTATRERSFLSRPCRDVISRTLSKVSQLTEAVRT
jgi:hypothetical protein